MRALCHLRLTSWLSGAINTQHLPGTLRALIHNAPRPPTVTPDDIEAANQELNSAFGAIEDLYSTRDQLPYPTQQPTTSASPRHHRPTSLHTHNHHVVHQHLHPDPTQWPAADSGGSGGLPAHQQHLSQQPGAGAAPKLTHVDDTGRAHMVDVSEKAPTKRTARASCVVRLGPVAFPLVQHNRVAKGDVLTTAQLAGIMAAKHTANLIPLCHNIPLSKVSVDLTLDPPTTSVLVSAAATTVSNTGVEMEALTAASVAALTVYDMCKAASKDIVISDLQLDSKTGGKSQDYARHGPTH